MGTPCAQLFFDRPGGENLTQPIKQAEPKQCAEHHAKPGDNANTTHEKEIFEEHLFTSPFCHALQAHTAVDFCDKLFANEALNPAAIPTGFVLG